eukprot:CAMPEP_0197595134 /NCGR_PEP_ID=MMETSP1326-20131121/22125_1 /TAXON_ID=1155430 /ORGANISM="Genus nov. species nov., Strain RCC2288" /LENGTH=157 /DNA_ID=CAMNT_0043161435 /DNA_START=36 /DNA_END=509 /DNA_ORIENTATION=-
METYVMELTKTMCKGLVRMLAGLKLAGKLERPPPSPFTEEEQNFWQRFGVFHVTPEPQALNYPDFAQYMSLDDIAPGQLFMMASDCFSQVRTQVKQLLNLPPGILTAEQAEDMAGLERVAAANMTAVRLVEMPGIEVDFEYKHHPIFASVLARRAKK